MTPAVQAAKRAGIAFQLHEFTATGSGPYGLEAATALQLPVAQVFKTLIAKIDGRRLVCALVPVEAELNLKALAELANGKRGEMAAVAEAQRSSGYVRGGISPLGQRRALNTFIDASALQHATLFVSAGRRGLEIELAPQDLIAACGAITGDIAKQT